MQEHFTKQCRGADAGFTHTNGIGLVDFGFEELGYEGEEDFAEYGGPFFVVGGSEGVG